MSIERIPGLEVVIEMEGEQVIGREGEWREWGHALGREGERGVSGGAYRGMRSSQAEESMLEVRKVKVEATVMGSEEDSSAETGWITERELGRGKLTRVELVVMEETEKEQVEKMLWNLKKK